MSRISSVVLLYIWVVLTSPLILLGFVSHALFFSFEAGWRLAGELEEILRKFVIEKGIA